MRRASITYLHHWLKLKSRRPLILRGARQVGKSTLVRQFAIEARLELIEVNLERHLSLNSIFASLDVDTISRELEAIAGRSISGTGTLLFLDEIQATPNGLAALRYFFEQRPDLPIIAAGSLLELALEDAEFSMPVGRVQYYHLGPCTFREFLEAHQDPWLLNAIGAFRIGLPWAEAAHERGLSRLREFLFVGGMPEALAMYVDDPTQGNEWKSSQQRIVDTYKDDFAKYGKRANWLSIIQSVYERLPNQVGRKIKYSELAIGHRTEQTHAAVDLLAKARIIHRAYHTDAMGVPIDAQKKAKVYKPYWIDVGLLNRLLGLNPALLRSDTQLIHQGPLAEQFVAQHLAYLQGPEQSPSLYYWLREGKSENAEVDFIIQLGHHIIPVEVKSKKAGALKSLQQFVGSRSTRLAVKLSLEPPSLTPFAMPVSLKSNAQCQLLSLPIYMVPWLSEIVEEWLVRNE